MVVSDSYAAAKPPAQAVAIRVGGYGLVVLSLVLLVSHLVRPGPWTAALLLLAPLALLMLVIGSPASFEHTARGRRVINGLLFLPFMWPLMINLRHAQVDPWFPLIPAVVLAIGILAASWSARTTPGLKSPRIFLIFMTLCGGVYGYGAVTATDIQFDRSAGTVITTQVQGKHISHGRQSTTYRIDLPPWGPETTPNSTEVSWATYNSLQIGGPACIVLHPGVLSLPWFTVGACGWGQALSDRMPG